jgi:uncharacterized membrane protein YjdF
MCADPRRRANTAATGEHIHPAQFDRVAHWFHEVYPAPFEHPALRQRLPVYDLVHRLAELFQRTDPRSIVSTLELGTSYERFLPG